MVGKFTLEFTHRRGRMQDGLTVKDAAEAATQALIYIESLAFFIGFVETSELQEESSDDLRGIYRAAMELLTEFSYIVSHNLDLIEERRKELEVK